jgi:lipoprotein-releasing system permease protein
MPEPTGSPPVAPSAWRLGYLRKRRIEGFISVIAGFSFVCVATLIIVVAAMNGVLSDHLCGADVGQPFRGCFPIF